MKFILLCVFLMGTYFLMKARQILREFDSVAKTWGELPNSFD